MVIVVSKEEEEEKEEKDAPSSSSSSSSSPSPKRGDFHVHHIAVPPRVDCCVVMSTSRIVASILDRPRRRRFRPLRRMRRRKLIFLSPPSPLPNVDPNRRIVFIAAPQ